MMQSLEAALIHLICNAPDCVVPCSRNDHGKYTRVDYNLPDVTGGEAIESAHGGTLPGHIIDMCLTQCSAISEGLL